MRSLTTAPPATADEVIVNQFSRRDGDFARKPLRAPGEPNLALQLTGDHVLHHARAEALVGGWRDGGTARLGPTQHDPAVCRARPLHLHVTLGHREGTVLARVGG